MRLFIPLTIKSFVTIHLPTRSVLTRHAPLIFLLFFWMISIWIESLDEKFVLYLSP